MIKLIRYSLLIGLFSVLVFVTHAKAAEIAFSSDGVIFRTYTVEPENYSKSIGELTFRYLNVLHDVEGLDFKGSLVGLNSIGSKGSYYVETTKDTGIAYGWCYSINGKIPDVMANKSFITQKSDKVLWFYGSMAKTNGIWESVCKPVVSPI